jgi:hypothetical protein
MASSKEYISAIKKVGRKDNHPIVKSVPKVVEMVGDELNGESIRLVYENEHKAFPEWEVAPTSKGVAAARREGLRIERIAARSGLTLAEVREFAEKEGVGADKWLGIGRKPGNGNGSSAPAKKASSGRRGGSKTAAAASGTSGRRGSGTKSKAAAAKTRGRRGTRASANPK